MVIDVVRTRKIRKRIASGKIKWKTKTKGSPNGSSAKLTTPKGRPGSPRRRRTRHLLVGGHRQAEGQPVRRHRAGQVRDARVAPTPGWQLNTVLLVLAELFRWVAPRRRRRRDAALPGVAHEPGRRRTRAVRVCTATTGFFVLERCERSGPHRCAPGARARICNRHTMQLPGRRRRPCAPSATPPPGGTSAIRATRCGPIGFRRSFYWEVSSSTGDDTWWAGFDDFDREAFTLSDADGDWSDIDGGTDGDGGFDDDGADFLDS